MTEQERLQMAKDAAYEYQKLRQRINRIRGNNKKSQRAVRDFEGFERMYKKGKSWKQLDAGELKTKYYTLYNMANNKSTYSKYAIELNEEANNLFEGYNKLSVDEQNKLWDRFTKMRELTEIARLPSKKIASMINYERTYNTKLNFKKVSLPNGQYDFIITDNAGRTPEEVEKLLKSETNKVSMRYIEQWRRS